MASALPSFADLKEDNRLLRQAIAEVRKNLASATARLREVFDEEAFVEELPTEVEAAVEAAAAFIANASRNLQQSGAQRGTVTTPGEPTQQQGQFLAYIRDYKLLNHGLAPTHADFQRFFNLTPPSVNSMLKRLDQKGFIRRIPGKARAIELTIDSELIPTLDQSPHRSAKN
jgi:hypothetical protein